MKSSVALCVAFLGVASALHLRPAKSEPPSETQGDSLAKLSPATEPATKKVVTKNAQPQPIFYMTAMSKLANKHQTRLWLSSVRHVGKWMGEVVIVTDKADCLEKNLGETLLGGAKLEDTDLMNVYPGGAGMGKVYFLKSTPGNIKQMKSEKAQAWINMAKLSLKPSFIVYTDQDIVFGENVNPVVQQGAGLVGKGHTMALFIDKGTTKGQLHTGIIFFFQGANTDKCLEAWGSKILTIATNTKYKGFDRQASEKEDMAFSEADGEKVEAEMMGPDQRALGKTSQCRQGQGIHILPSNLLMMPTSGLLNAGKKGTFIHFTNTNRWKSINHQVMSKYFRETLGLPAQEWFEYETC